MQIIEKTCPSCKTEFTQEIKKGYGRTYCSRSCANRRTHSDATKQKIGRTVKNTWNAKSEEGKKKALDALKKGQETRRQNWLKFLQESNTEDLAHESRKRKVFLEQDESCLQCGIADWQGQPLTFELDHIDGDKLNNTRENLRVLCPNCHAQTDTWRGRKNTLVSPNGEGLS